MMESGHAKVVGRLKEMVNRGGENVYPREVEDFLKTHPKIEDAQLFGVPDSRMGEEPAVWIQLKEGEVMTPNDLKAFCKGQV
jgi:fatty-acyl-CoA synthase